MIEVKNLTKQYGDKRGVNNISFTVNEGEILGFLGPNGAGKSTTMNILTGYLSATSGVAKIGEFDILENPMEAKRYIGYLPEQPPLYLDMTVKEYLNFIYDLKKCKLPRQHHIEQVCSVVKIKNVYTRLIKNLSKGYKQRVGLAQALIGNPKVLILDEPTVGLDPKQIIEIRNLIKSLSEQHTIILSSHILTEVQAVCDRIVVINEGKLVADDTESNLSNKLSKDNRFTVRIEGEIEAIMKALSKVSVIKSITEHGEKEEGVYEFVIEGNEGVDIRREVFDCVIANGFRILELHATELSLEDIFLKLTNGTAILEAAAEQEKEEAEEAAQPEAAVSEEDVEKAVVLGDE
ncbi:MAG: ATP-binding cassette domain-containing protein [Clostridia bacterium]|nr:ATP-binding cassette domain-containing protein [Clostridia bacterium]